MMRRKPPFVVKETCCQATAGNNKRRILKIGKAGVWEITNRHSMLFFYGAIVPITSVQFHLRMRCPHVHPAHGIRCELARRRWDGIWRNQWSHLPPGTHSSMLVLIIWPMILPSLGHLKKFTFQCHRKFVNQRRIHKFALAYMESGFFQLMGFRISRNHPHIVRRNQVGSVGKTDAESTFFLNVFCRFVAGTQAKYHLVTSYNPPQAAFIALAVPSSL